MPSNKYSFYASLDKMDMLHDVVDENKYPTLNSIVNAALDKYIELHKISILTDIMYPIGITFWVFLISIALTLYLASLLFYVITAFAGMYLMVFIFLFYKKYEGIKWR